jgi:hypothetical protein
VGGVLNLFHHREHREEHREGVVGKLLYKVTILFEDKKRKTYDDVENVYIAGSAMTIVQRPKGGEKVVVETVVGVKAHRAEAQQ